MKKRRSFLIATMAAALLMAFGGAAAQAAGSVPAAATHQQTAQEPGLVIVSVDPNGPAAAAGVKRGDILLEVDGRQTDRARDVLLVIRSLQPDDEIKVRVLHGDDERTLDLTVGERNGQPYLGLQPYVGGQGMMIPDVEVTESTVPGALIASVVPDSPAAKAGLEVGDVITAVDGKALGETADLASVIGEHQPGDKITLEVVKSGADDTPSEISVTLVENPDNADKALLGVRYSATSGAHPLDEEPTPSVPAEPGTPSTPTPRLGPFFFRHGQLPFPMPGSEAGAEIQSVVKKSPAESAGLQVGDVITEIDGEAVASPQDLVDAVGAKKPGDLVTLTVERTGETDPLTIEVTLGEKPDTAGKAYLGVSIGAIMIPQDSTGQTQDNSLFGFELPFDLDKLPFDLDKLPLPFRFEQSAPSGQEPA